jgi:magnesium transporter
MLAWAPGPTMIRSLFWGATANAGHGTGDRRMHCLRSIGDSECGSDMRVWQQNGGLIWIDLLKPDRAQVDTLAEVFGLHRIAVDIVLTPRSRAKLTTFDHFFTLTMYGSRDLPIVRRHEAPLDRVQEIELLVGEGFLISVHDDPIPALETVWRAHEQDTSAPEDVSEVVHEIMDAVVDRFFPTLDEMVDRVEGIQEIAFLGQDGGVLDRQKVNELFSLKKQLSTLNRILEPQRSAIAVLARQELPYFRSEGAAFQDIYDHAGRQADMISVYINLLMSARESYMVRVSNVLATSAKTLLTLTLFLSVPTFIFTLYGMNFDHMPELRLPLGHATPLVLVLLADTALFLYFQRKVRLFG